MFIITLGPVTYAVSCPLLEEMAAALVRIETKLDAAIDDGGGQPEGQITIHIGPVTEQPRSPQE